MKTRRRYTRDHLIYEAFYAAIVNSLIVALAPLGIFLLLAAIENFPMNERFILTTLSIVQMVFIITFFVNFLYYTIFIRFRLLISYVIVLVVSCLIGFFLFFSDYHNIFSDEHSAIVVVTWFMLLAMILIGHKTGWLDRDNSRYDEESWLFKHQLADDGGETAADRPDPLDEYTHKYIDHHDENAPERPNKVIDPENDPKRASRLT